MPPRAALSTGRPKKSDCGGNAADSRPLARRARALSRAGFHARSRDGWCGYSSFSRRGASLVAVSLPARLELSPASLERCLGSKGLKTHVRALADPTPGDEQSALAKERAALAQVVASRTGA